MVKRGGLTPEAAASHFWVLDAQGLVTQYRPGLPSYVSAFARPTSCSVADEGDGLLEVVRKVKPTVLLGLAGEALVPLDNAIAHQEYTHSVQPHCKLCCARKGACSKH
jgi:malate dehydrogenase (decarboxylating)